jgi:hypothetical protein
MERKNERGVISSHIPSFLRDAHHAAWGGGGLGCLNIIVGYRGGLMGVWPFLGGYERVGGFGLFPAKG